jgi:hypothetical protein
VDDDVEIDFRLSIRADDPEPDELLVQPVDRVVVGEVVLTGLVVGVIDRVGRSEAMPVQQRLDVLERRRAITPAVKDDGLGWHEGPSGVNGERAAEGRQIGG